MLMLFRQQHDRCCRTHPTTPLFVQHSLYVSLIKLSILGGMCSHATHLRHLWVAATAIYAVANYNKGILVVFRNTLMPVLFKSTSNAFLDGDS